MLRSIIPYKYTKAKKVFAIFSFVHQLRDRIDSQKSLNNGSSFF